MPDHPPKPPKLPSLPPPPRLQPPKEPPTTPRPPSTRGSGSSEVPPPIEVSDAPTPPLGIPKVAAFESRTLGAWRAYLPSFEQWMIACACVLAAATVGFWIGRSTAVSVTAVPECPSVMNHPTAAAQAPVATPAPVAAPIAETRVEPTVAPPDPNASASSAPLPDATADAAAQQATEKAIARAMSRGARRATTCRGASSPAGTAHVTATFLPTGEVKSAIVRGAPFAGTAEGECIVSKFRPLRVPPFTGDNVTAKKDFALE